MSLIIIITVQKPFEKKASSTRVTFDVIQGHWYRWQLIGHIWFSISLPLQLSRSVFQILTLIWHNLGCHRHTHDDDMYRVIRVCVVKMHELIRIHYFYEVSIVMWKIIYECEGNWCLTLSVHWTYWGQICRHCLKMYPEACHKIRLRKLQMP